MELFEEESVQKEKKTKNVIVIIRSEERRVGKEC